MSNTTFKKTAVPKPSGGRIQVPTDNPPAQQQPTQQAPAPDGMPRGNVPRPGQPSTPRPGGGGGGKGYYGNVAIMTMQHALQDLAQAVSSQLNLADPKQNEAKGRDAFGVFLTKNYMRNTKVPGVEYDPDPRVTDVAKKRPDDPTRMSVVMDTMHRVGNPKKGENFVDGVWSARTNAAVRNSYAFAAGMLEFVDDINKFAQKKIQIKSYDRSQLAELEKYATADNTLTAQEKIQAAPFVTKQVKAIKNMYEEIKNAVLQRPAYQQFIEGSVPFKTYQPAVTQQQVDSVKSMFPSGIEVKFKNFASVVPVDALKNLESLKAWMQQAAPDAVQRGELTPETVVSAIWAQNKQLIGSDMGY